jgi:alpha-glucosidase
MLALYRAGLQLRRALPELGDGGLTWISSADSVLAFERGDGFACFVNYGPGPVDLPPGATVLISSTELEGGALPHDSTAWLRQATDPVSDKPNGPAPGTDPALRKG